MEINNHNTENKKTTKRKAPRRTPSFDLNGDFTWIENRVSEAQVRHLAKQLVDWAAHDPKARSITRFCFEKGITRSTFYRLIDKYVVLKEAHELAMTFLGENLWEKAVDRKVDWKAVHWRLYRYGSDFLEDYKFHKQMAVREESGANGIDRFVVMEKMPETSVVKAREIHEENK